MTKSNIYLLKGCSQETRRTYWRLELRRRYGGRDQRGGRTAVVEHAKPLNRFNLRIQLLLAQSGTLSYKLHWA